jgi:hypothetical protein
MIGTILTTGRRTVAAALRTMGLAHDHHFQNYHRLLNRAKWSSLRCSEILLRLLVKAFCPQGPIVVGGDETLERRQGQKISKLGVYRDAARSSRSFFVKSTGLRWVCLMLLTPIPWAQRIWALPFLSVLAPSKRYCQEHKKRHKKITDWMAQMLIRLRRWLKEREIVFVGDGGYASLNLLDLCVRLHITAVTRLRLDAALFEPAPERKPGTNGRPRKKGARLPTLEQIADAPETQWQDVVVQDWYDRRERTVQIVSQTCVWFHGGQEPVAIRWVLIRDPKGHFATQALLCTDLQASPQQIIAWFVQRWQLETTFQQVRTHLGMETQRQWSDLAIERSTPILLGLYSIVTLMAHALLQEGGQHPEAIIRKAAWYPKLLPTFSDAIALVRRTLWRSRLASPESFVISGRKPDITKPDPNMINTLVEILAYAA